MVSSETSIPNICVKKSLTSKLLPRHTYTHTIDFTTWTTEVVGKNSSCATRYMTRQVAIYSYTAFFTMIILLHFYSRTKNAITALQKSLQGELQSSATELKR